MAQNEAVRLKMRESNYTPKFAVTPEQRASFKGTPYANDESAMKQTILARIASGDPSALNVTPEQKMEANTFINPPVSQADLKRIDGAAAPAEAPTPVSFENLSQQIVQRAADQRKAREDEYLSRQKLKDDESGLWETAKQQILQGVTPEDLEITESDFSDQSTRNPYALLSRLGKKEADEAFSTKEGKKVPWSDVLAALVSDPRWKQAASGGQESTPTRKSFSNLWGGK